MSFGDLFTILMECSREKRAKLVELKQGKMNGWQTQPETHDPSLTTQALGNQNKKFTGWGASKEESEAILASLNSCNGTFFSHLFEVKPETGNPFNGNYSPPFLGKGSS